MSLINNNNNNSLIPSCPTHLKVFEHFNELKDNSVTFGCPLQLGGVYLGDSGDEYSIVVPRILNGSCNEGCRNIILKQLEVTQTWISVNMNLIKNTRLGIKGEYPNADAPLWAISEKKPEDFEYKDYEDFKDDRLKQDVDEMFEKVPENIIRGHLNMLYNEKELTEEETRHQFNVKSAIPTPEEDEVIPEQDSDVNIANSDFETIFSNSNEEEEILPFHDNSRFTAFIPKRASPMFENVVNNSAKGYAKRKASRSLVTIREGTGRFTVNGRDFAEYFQGITHKDTVLQPLVLTETLVKWDIDVRVRGGGFKGQAEATARAIAVAMCHFDIGYRPTLRYIGALKHDSRKVERKKPGQYKARKKHPLVKR
eukprot:gene9755-11983_t